MTMWTSKSANTETTRRPPDKEPLFAHRYVAFTSPNENWIRDVKDESGRTMLYMPLWDVPELKTAVEALGLSGALGAMKDAPDFPRGVDPSYADEVTYRFAVFGGVARPCLVADAAVVASRLQDLQTAVAAVDVMAGKIVMESDDVMDGKGNKVEKHGKEEKELSRVLYHCYPSPWVIVPNIKVASSYVTYLLSTEVAKLSEEKRARFKDFEFTCLSEAMALRRSLLKIRLPSLLEQGVQLVAIALPLGTLTPYCDLKLTIQLNEAVVATVSSRFRSVEARGPCFVPQSNEFESIDGFYVVKLRGQPGDCDDSDGDTDESENDMSVWSDVKLVVFQVVTMSDPTVDGKELFALLRRMNCDVDAACRVALVFVVPEEEVDYFDRQFVEGRDCLNDGYPLTAVDGVTTDMATTLKAAKITCVQDLRQQPASTLDAEQQHVYELAQSCLRSQEETTATTGSANHKMLQYIPQFVWGVPM